MISIQAIRDNYTKNIKMRDTSYVFLKEKMYKFGLLGSFSYKVYLLREDYSRYTLHEYNLAEGRVGKIVAKDISPQFAYELMDNPEHYLSEELFNSLEAKAKAKKLIGIDDGI